LRKSSCLGSLTISSPLAFAEGLFYLFRSIFTKKEGFLNYVSKLNNIDHLHKYLYFD